VGCRLVLAVRVLGRRRLLAARVLGCRLLLVARSWAAGCGSPLGWCSSPLREWW
jgi:hypothetical protein